MHTDGKPRVVRVCDVGVSKGLCVCVIYVDETKVEAIESHSSAILSRCTSSYAPEISVQGY